MEMDGWLNEKSRHEREKTAFTLAFCIHISLSFPSLLDGVEE
jgi:hypothetical protein